MTMIRAPIRAVTFGATIQAAIILTPIIAPATRSPNTTAAGPVTRPPPSTAQTDAPTARAIPAQQARATIQTGDFLQTRMVTCR